MARPPKMLMDQDPAVPDGAHSIGRFDDLDPDDHPSGPSYTGIETGTAYFAGCQDHPGPNGWIGPNRRTREEAQADADDHNRSFPGHNAVVV